MPELEADFARQQRLQVNVERLRVEYIEEKLRLAEREALDAREGREVEGRRMGVLESAMPEVEGREEPLAGEEAEKESLRRKFGESSSFILSPSLSSWGRVSSIADLAHLLLDLPPSRPHSALRTFFPPSCLLLHRHVGSRRKCLQATPKSRQRLPTGVVGTRAQEAMIMRRGW